MADSNSVFGTAQPLQGSASDWIDGQERMDFAYRDEQRKLAALDQQARERAEAKQAARAEKYKEYKGSKPTGIGGLDELLLGVGNDALDKILEFHKKEEAQGGLSPQDGAVLKRIMQIPQTLEFYTKKYEDADKAYNEAVAAGKIERDPGYEEKRQRLVEGASWFIDDEGIPVIGMDNDKDGRPDIISFDSLFDFQPNMVEKIDLDEDIKKVASTLETEIKTTDGNFRKRTIEEVPLKVLQDIAITKTYSQDGMPAKEARSHFAVRGNYNPTEEDLEGFRKMYLERLVNSKTRRDETDVDYASQRMAQKDAKGEDKGGIGNPVIPTVQTWGSTFEFIDPNKNRSVPVTKKVKLPGVEVTVARNKKTGAPVQEKLAEATVLNYTYDKEGRLVVDVSYPQGKLSEKADGTTVSQNLVAKKQFVATKETESRLAKELGMTLEELKASATNPDAGKETAAERALRIANGG